MSAPSWANPATCRDLRLAALRAARSYRAEYFRERFGFLRRMWAAKLTEAREYRSGGREPHHQQEAA